MTSTDFDPSSAEVDGPAISCLVSTALSRAEKTTAITKVRYQERELFDDGGHIRKGVARQADEIVGLISDPCRALGWLEVDPDGPGAGLECCPGSNNESPGRLQAPARACHLCGRDPTRTGPTEVPDALGSTCHGKRAPGSIDPLRDRTSCLRRASSTPIPHLSGGPVASTTPNRVLRSSAGPDRMVGLKFGLLGPTVIVGEEGEIAVRGTLRRRLLIRLLLSANLPVSPDRLIEDLWDGTAPPSAESTLKSHVSLLRRTLGPERLTHRDGGYVLALDPDEFDVTLFEQDASGGRSLLRAGEFDRAADCSGQGPGPLAGSGHYRCRRRRLG